MMLAGASRLQVADAVGIHPTRIWQWTQIPEFAAELERQREAIQLHATARIAGEVDKSLDRIVALRDGGRQERVQLAAAQDLLDRADMRPAERVHNVHEHILSPEFARLLEAVRKEEDVVDTVVIDGVAQLPERQG